MNQQTIDRIRRFTADRDWGQFHTPANLAKSIAIEAAELLEVFQWSGADLEVASKAAKAREELADVAIYCIYMADRLGVDLADAISDKIDANGEKYPVEKSRSSSRKYTEL